MTAAFFFSYNTPLCPVIRLRKEIFPIFFPSCKYWIIYLLANSQHCQHPVVKIYLCPDKFSSRLQSDYSLLPDILLDAIPVYTVVNHRLPITVLHKTRLVFKSGHKNEGRRWDNWTQASLGALTEHEHSGVCASVFVESPICFLTYFLLSKGDIGPPSILSHYFFLERFSLIQNTLTDCFRSFKEKRIPNLYCWKVKQKKH